MILAKFLGELRKIEGVPILSDGRNRLRSGTLRLDMRPADNPMNGNGGPLGTVLQTDINPENQ